MRGRAFYAQCNLFHPWLTSSGHKHITQLEMCVIPLIYLMFHPLLSSKVKTSWTDS